MSESIKLIYKILKILENSMDYSELGVELSDGLISGPLKPHLVPIKGSHYD